MVYIAYLMIGYGIGYLTTKSFKGNNTKLDRMKHELSVRKEWYRMLAEQKRTNSKWPAQWP